MLRARKSFSDNALDLIKKRYLQKDPDTLNVIEDESEFFVRIARSIADVELSYGKSQEESDKFYHAMLEGMDNFRFLPAGRNLAGAGGNVALIPNCCVLGLEDTMESIFQTMKDAALLQQSGVGCGFCFSALRPAGSIVQTAKSYASGPVSFLRVYNEAFRTIKQQMRSGANMCTHAIDHPDCISFIKCKDQEGAINCFNISLLLTDEFMETATNPNHPKYNDVWECNFNGKKYKPRIVERDEKNTVTKIEETNYTARQILDLIIFQAHKNGEPGVIFIDTVNATNPLPLLGPITASNPCITGDSVIMTSKGPKTVYELINKPFDAVVDGRSYHCGTGFFESGIKPIYELRTKEGYSLKLTSDHKVRCAESYSTKEGRKEKWVELQNLKPGDQIIINDVGGIDKWEGLGTYDEGWLIGNFIADGHYRKNETVSAVLEYWGPNRQYMLDFAKEKMKSIQKCDKYDKRRKGFHNDFHKKTGISSRRLAKLCSLYGIDLDKKIDDDLYIKTSSEFQKGFICGVIDGDGSVQGQKHSGVNIRLTSISLNHLHVVQNMLINLGIKSTIYHNRKKETSKLMPDGRGGMKLYNCKPVHELVISRHNITLFNEKIGFVDPVNKEKFHQKLSEKKNPPQKDPFIARVDTVSLIGEDLVYDCTVDIVHRFGANGIMIANCSEQFLHPGDICLLIAMNLGEYVIWNGENYVIDYKLMERDLRILVRMGDNIIDMYKIPVKLVADQAKNNRRIGIGAMGFADMLIKLRVRYGSDKCIEIIDEMMTLWKSVTVDESQKLAIERGEFPNWEKSIYFLNGEPKRRNAALTNMAPTGSISRIFDCSSSLEPHFMFAYQSNILNMTVKTFNPLLKEELIKLDLFDNERIIDEIVKTGSIQNIPEIPEETKNVFVGSMDITPEDHIRVQTTFQKYIDNAISKTINFPESASLEDIERGYIQAWSGGAKGCTVYRNNSRVYQVLETIDRQKTSTDELEQIHADLQNAYEDIKLGKEGATAQLDSIMARLNKYRNIEPASPICSSSSEADDVVIEVESPKKKKPYCLSCKSVNVVMQEKCMTCLDCLWSPCSS